MSEQSNQAAQKRNRSADSSGSNDDAKRSRLEDESSSEFDDEEYEENDSLGGTPPVIPPKKVEVGNDILPQLQEMEQQLKDVEDEKKRTEERFSRLWEAPDAIRTAMRSVTNAAKCAQHDQFEEGCVVCNVHCDMRARLSLIDTALNPTQDDKGLEDFALDLLSTLKRYPAHQQDTLEKASTCLRRTSDGVVTVKPWSVTHKASLTDNFESDMRLAKELSLQEAFRSGDRLDGNDAGEGSSKRP